MIKSYEFTLLKKCKHCGLDLPLGFARCQDRSCLKLRQEFEQHAAVVSNSHGPCMWKGETTDVRLPDGRYLCAPYFLDAVRAAWLDGNYRFTEKFRAARQYRAKG